MPEETLTEDIDMSSTEASDLATALNALGSNYLDPYGQSWTTQKVLDGHTNTDANKRKRLIRLLALLAAATG